MCLKVGVFMKCKFCGNEDSKVIDSRTNDDSTVVRRRRECTKCGNRFTTLEEYETTPILVVKRDGTRQVFDKEKLKRGIIKACEKRPVNINQIDDMVASIEKEINNSLVQEIDTNTIGQKVMQKLKQVDEVAYVRFASVYRQFKDISNFIELLDDFKKEIKK